MNKNNEQSSHMFMDKTSQKILNLLTTILNIFCGFIFFVVGKRFKFIFVATKPLVSLLLSMQDIIKNALQV